MTCIEWHQKAAHYFLYWTESDVGTRITAIHLVPSQPLKSANCPVLAHRNLLHCLQFLKQGCRGKQSWGSKVICVLNCQIFISVITLQLLSTIPSSTVCCSNCSEDMLNFLKSKHTNWKESTHIIISYLIFLSLTIPTLQHTLCFPYWNQASHKIELGEVYTIEFPPDNKYIRNKWIGYQFKNIF